MPLQPRTSAKQVDLSDLEVIGEKTVAGALRKHKVHGRVRLGHKEVVWVNIDQVLTGKFKLEARVSR